MSSRKIDHKTRDLACLRLQVMASSTAEAVNDDREVAASLGITREAHRLAWAAWRHVAKFHNWAGDVLAPSWDAEAEAFLRAGNDPDESDYEANDRPSMEFPGE